MDAQLQVRSDLISTFNTADFKLWHYAKGYYPVSGSQQTSKSVNRMFFPLENPGGAVLTARVLLLLISSIFSFVYLRQKWL